MTRFEVWGTISTRREGYMFHEYETKLLGTFTYHKDAVKFAKTCYKKHKAFETKIKKVSLEYLTENKK